MGRAIVAIVLATGMLLCPTSKAADSPAKPADAPAKLADAPAPAVSTPSPVVGSKSPPADSRLLPCLPGQDPTAPSGPIDYAETLQAARKAMELPDYEQAMGLVGRIGPDAPPLIRVQALEIGASVQLIYGRAALAQPLLEELYFMAPGFLVDDPSLSPSVTKLFDEEAARPHKRAVKMELRPREPDLRSFVLTAKGATAKVTLACRSGGKGPFLPVKTVLAKGLAQFRLPSSGAFQCHGVALDRDALPLGRFGTPKAAVIISSRKPLPPPPPPALWERWYFWAGVTAIVAGGVVTTAVLVARQESPPEADVTVELQPSGAATIWRW